MKENRLKGKLNFGATADKNEKGERNFPFAFALAVRR
jgi:hypothetical protein